MADVKSTLDSMDTFLEEMQNGYCLKEGGAQFVLDLCSAFRRAVDMYDDAKAVNSILEVRLKQAEDIAIDRAQTIEMLEKAIVNYEQTYAGIKEVTRRLRSLSSIASSIPARFDAMNAEIEPLRALRDVSKEISEIDVYTLWWDMLGAEKLTQVEEGPWARWAEALSECIAKENPNAKS